jgi:kynurenine formamidase
MVRSKEGTMEKFRIIDLSASLENSGEKFSEEIKYIDHEESIEVFAKPRGLGATDLPDGKYCAVEYISLNTHMKTHMDAPWHYGPTSKGIPAKTIDEIPLEWCYGDGVILNFSYKKKGELITPENVQNALKEIRYTLRPFDIVLIRTDASKHIGEEGYENMHPGMVERLPFVIGQGVRVMGIDAGDGTARLMPWKMNFGGESGQVLGGTLCWKRGRVLSLENLVNLDQIPQPYGFKVAAFL